MSDSSTRPDGKTDGGGERTAGSGAGPAAPAARLKAAASGAVDGLQMPHAAAVPPVVNGVPPAAPWWGPGAVSAGPVFPTAIPRSETPNGWPAVYPVHYVSWPAGGPAPAVHDAGVMPGIGIAYSGRAGDAAAGPPPTSPPVQPTLLDFRKIRKTSLRKYLRHFRIELDADKAASKEHMARAVREHFSTMHVADERQVLEAFRAALRYGRP